MSVLSGMPRSARPYWRKRAVLRDLINATIGFEQLAADLQKPSKSLHRP
jgi:hypothetical protein